MLSLCSLSLERRAVMPRHLCPILILNKDSQVRQLAQIQPLPSTAVWPWACCLASLGSYFLICQMRMNEGVPVKLLAQCLEHSEGPAHISTTTIITTPTSVHPTPSTYNNPCLNVQFRELGREFVIQINNFS